MHLSELAHQWWCQNSKPDSKPGFHTEKWRQGCSRAQCYDVAGGDRGWLNTVPQRPHQGREPHFQRKWQVPVSDTQRRGSPLGALEMTWGDELRLLSVTPPSPEHLGAPYSHLRDRSPSDPEHRAAPPLWALAWAGPLTYSALVMQASLCK